MRLVRFKQGLKQKRFNSRKIVLLCNNSLELCCHSENLRSHKMSVVLLSCDFNEMNKLQRYSSVKRNMQQ